mmetsp:Transcript_5039/g.10932  ORF Transcript_5039/g.10932 Transcript_5039/m.10932 type:complete len:498 (-) Transcript_5039:665-2158(-)|eukprot:CAMPEP_0202894806 /NCGR_PEP_ID=MMETSP1392-20130828/4118_1 /ASSEMBLY_ACC=CAM_ASM_000868 /TAXON_ID=225041 /ORGANISM="Chlamydomonas chlamydogama, Strain SAG 11-48b" /LENGTH=497 /DNA_ID=CAMNT_0049579605 /DNA_START=74 /DNA_END=1567 /DNA_ORIENTATION=-
MEFFYVSLFVSLVLLALSLELNQGSWVANDQDTKVTPQFKAFRNNYLLVYSLMMAGDWLQGPYIYALYEHYGYKVGDIGRLFIAGFGSSMVFGTIVGALADKYGRRCASIVYVISYSLSCLTKHSGEYWVLMLGRLLGGVSTSLLFSAFESWLVAEHYSRGFAPSLLGDTFSKSVFLGAGLMAILSGLLGNVLVEDLGLGAVAPFDAAIAVMVIGGIIVASTWPENYGDESYTSLGQQFSVAMKAIVSDRKIVLLGAMQSMFEASMYTFVFLWTPALSPSGEKIPHGMVFSCFMTACMAGSALTGMLMRRAKVERFMVAVFVLSAVAMAVPFLFHLEHRDHDAGSSLVENGKGGITWEGRVQLLAFCLFEGCIGVFWPSMMALRARYVPEELRSTIINIFRVPLNLFVCLGLYEVSNFPLSVMFGLCVIFLMLCMLCQIWLNRLIAKDAQHHVQHHATKQVGHSSAGASKGESEGKVLEHTNSHGAKTSTRAVASMH